MSKVKTKYVCQHCGYISPKWMGKCPGCHEWNGFVEELVTKTLETKHQSAITGGKPVALHEIEVTDEDRFNTGIEEFNRVLGGGLVPGSLILVGGDPGIGKSTLMMQIAAIAASKGKSVLYLSGEESPAQLKIRAQRLGLIHGAFKILPETNMEIIKRWVQEIAPDVLIVDSIQTIYTQDIPSVPGSVSQVREVTALLMNMTKTSQMATFIVGHVTKQGAIAGPRILEHMVDTVLYFEGDSSGSFRILRAVKNRFGSTNEIGVFEMRETGLVEIDNPSRLFIENSEDKHYGTAVASALEGTRPILVEIQALISGSNYGQPRRVTTGVDHSRVAMIMAVLEKKLGMQLQSSDAYVNVIGGLQLKETAVDLAILAAIVSSHRERPVQDKTLIIGEVGLTGEVRGVGHIEKRVQEGLKLGFERIIIPKTNFELISKTKGIKLIPVSNIMETIDYL